jgi:hypothetical protein
MVLHPLAKAKEVLRFYREYARSCPDELTAFAAMMTLPEGVPVVAIVVGYTISTAPPAEWSRTRPPSDCARISGNMTLSRSGWIPGRRPAISGGAMRDG